MRVDLFGVPVDVLPMDETVARICTAISRRERLHHVALNVAKLVNMRSDPELAADVQASDMVGIDGMGIILALRLLGKPVAERVAGIDLMEQVISAAADKGFRVYLLGARPDVLRRAAANMQAKFPGLQIAGMHDGYFSADQEPDVVDAIRQSRADCLFVAMPTPRKERFLAAHRDTLGVPFIMGVGGSFDIWAGHVKRAPGQMQRWGLEWLYRIYQEPRRMWWRYARTNSVFAGLLLATMARQIMPGQNAAEPGPKR